MTSTLFSRTRNEPAVVVRPSELLWWVPDDPAPRHDAHRRRTNRFVRPLRTFLSDVTVNASRGMTRRSFVTRSAATVAGAVFTTLFGWKHAEWVGALPDCAQQVSPPCATSGKAFSRGPHPSNDCGGGSNCWVEGSCQCCDYCKNADGAGICPSCDPYLRCVVRYC